MFTTRKKINKLETYETDRIPHDMSANISFSDSS